MFLALLLAQTAFYDPQAIMYDLKQAREAYIGCVIDQTVRVGEGNSETAETVLKAAASLCRSQEANLQTAYERTPVSRLRVTVLLDRDRRQAEEDATAALLTSRVN